MYMARRLVARHWQLRREPETIVAVLALLAVVSGLLHVASPFNGNGDVAWLIVVGERVLSGQRLYVDILETNPPMSLFLYMPPIWLAKQVGIAAELTVTGWVLSWAALSLWLAWRFCAAAGIQTTAGKAVFVGAAAYGLVILPAWSFGEREHMAAIGLLPYLLMTAGRWNGVVPSTRRTLVVGVLAGLTLCIKPHFALILLLPTLARVAACRRMGALFTYEHALAGSIALAYLAIVVTQYPQFLAEMMELNRIAYLPSTLTPRDLLVAPSSLLTLGLITVVVLARARLRSALAVVLLAAAAGGLCSYVLQAKGWPYHQIPTLTFGFLALVAGFVISLLERDREAETRQLAWGESGLVVAVLAMMGFFGPQLFSVRTDTRQLEAEIAKYSNAPSILIASSNLGVHFPLVRRTQARWEGRASSLWMMEGAARLLPQTRDVAKREALLRVYRWEREMFAEDAVKSRPDMIGLAYKDADKNLYGWAREVPALARLLEDYRQVAVADGIALLVRQDVLHAKGGSERVMAVR